MAKLIKLECATCGGRLDKIADDCYQCRSCRSKYEHREEQENTSQLNDIFLAAKARQRGMFYDALKQYEDILLADKNNFEALWGAMLADMSIVYSNRDGVAIPVFYDAKNESVHNNKYYKKAIAQCTFSEDYRNIASKIESLRIAAREQAKKNKVDVVIICREKEGKQQTKEAVMAMLLASKLTALNIKVFFSLTDLASCPYDDYEPYIYGALKNAKVGIIMASCEDNLNVDYVRNAWKRYVSYGNKNSIAVMCDCGEEVLPVELHKSAEQFVADGGIAPIVDRVKQILGMLESNKAEAKNGGGAVIAEKVAVDLAVSKQSSSASKAKPKATSEMNKHSNAEPPRPGVEVQVQQSVQSSKGSYGSIQTSSTALTDLAQSIKTYNMAQKQILDQCMSSLQQLTYQWNDNHINEIIRAMSITISNYDAKSNQANAFAEWLKQKAIMLANQKNIRN